MGDEDAEGNVRAWAADTLGRSGATDAEVEAVLRKGLQSADPALKAGCAGALWRLGILDGRQSAAILKKALAVGSEDYHVRP